MTLLTGEDVEKLTGYKRRPQQCRWLRKRGYHFEVNGRGKVVVFVGESREKRQPTLGVVK